MEIRPDRVEHYSVLHDLFKEKTSLHRSERKLVFGLFVFLIKRNLIRDGSVKIIEFGTFEVVPYQTRKSVRFRTAKLLRKAIREKTHQFRQDRYLYSHELDSYIRTASVIFGITRRKAAFLFNLFIYGIVETLLQKKVVNLWTFCKLVVRPISSGSEVIRMKRTRALYDEVNKKVDKIKVSVRLKQLLEKIDVSRDV